MPEEEDSKKRCPHCTSYLCGRKCTWARLSKKRAKKAARDALIGLRAAAGRDEAGKAEERTEREA